MFQSWLEQLCQVISINLQSLQHRMLRPGHTNHRPQLMTSAPSPASNQPHPGIKGCFKKSYPTLQRETTTNECFPMVPVRGQVFRFTPPSGPESSRNRRRTYVLVRRGVSLSVCRGDLFKLLVPCSLNITQFKLLPATVGLGLDESAHVGLVLCFRYPLRYGGGRCGGSEDASLLSVWRHCEHSLEDGEQRSGDYTRIFNNPSPSNMR